MPIRTDKTEQLTSFVFYKLCSNACKMYVNVLYTINQKDQKLNEMIICKHVIVQRVVPCHEIENL